MYWDAYSREEDSDLRKSFLVADSISSNASMMLEEWNERKDRQGNEYNLEFKPLSDYNLD